MGGVPDEALKYLVLRLNEQARAHCEGFFERQVVFVEDVNAAYRTREPAPDHLIVLTVARFEDNYYSMREGQVSVVALGNWRRAMAPPSIVEFVLTLVTREAIGNVSERLRKSAHLGTKGCPCDIALDLRDARQKTLSRYLCVYCRKALEADGVSHLIPDIERMLDKSWLFEGDTTSPAAVVAALGHDLFIVKGLRPTAWESCKSALREDGPKHVLTIIATITLGVLVVILGLRT